MKKIITDVAVIGGGTSGLVAAVAAAERGAKVTVIEKASTTGGTGNMAMGPFAVESKLQRARKISLTRDKVFEIFMNYTHWNVDARLVRAYIDKSASTIDWLESLGVEFIDVQCHNFGFEFTWHIIKGPSTRREMPEAAAAMMKRLTGRAKELGVEILLRTPAKRILKKDKIITGLAAEDASGEEIAVDAKAVIVASGGFSDNVDWIKKYTGYEDGRDLFATRIPGLAGDGIRMAWETGAAPTEMHMHMGCGIKDLDTFIEANYAFRQPSLMINLFGERFMNEEIIQTTPFGGNPISRQKDRCAFIIIDEDTKKYYEEVELDYPPGILVADPITKISKFDEEFKKALDSGNKDIYIADSLKELSEKTGINLYGLQKTINEYNQACVKGRDEIFNKNYKYLRPVIKPKFYAAKYTLGALGTLGGIKINYKTEVVSKDFEVIPGLYAAGGDANTIYGDTYLFTLPGNTLGFALNSGRMAGENAADYIKTLKK